MSYTINYLKLLLIAGTLLISCRQQSKTTNKPNILWIYLEDTSPLLSSYGTTLISTPNIDKLAERGVLYLNAFMPAPVCSPSRSSIITGLMSTTLGLHNHHSSRTGESAIYLPDTVTTIPELFKNAGYYTFNNGKDDYNFSYDRKVLYDQDYQVHPLYGKRGEPVKISALKNNEPFFGQIQLRGGKEIFSGDFTARVNSPVPREEIKLPPYLPNHPVLVEEYARHLDAIQITDEKVGAIIDELADNGLLNNTIVFFFSDHGMRLTRHKQFLYDGGLHVPLIITDFTNSGMIKAGSRVDDLISGLDIGPSSLALAGIPIPDYMEGVSIFNPSISPREYVISTRDRCDFTIDRIRSVRTKKYKYIRNFMTDRPYTQPTYMDVDSVEFVKTMKDLYVENKLEPPQARFFSRERPEEELYDLIKDPYELDNLAKDPNHASTLIAYRETLDKWIVETDDKGQYPESEEGLKFMLGIWGANAINKEYDSIRKRYPDLEGSLAELKNQAWKRASN